MPVTASEVLFFCGGAVVGAVAMKAYPQIKPKIEPLLSSAEGVVGDKYTDMARKMAERIEAIYDAMAEVRMKQQAGDAPAPGPAAPSAAPAT